eukprot:365979-Chlamydomonas_euryale.AAC.7
MRACSLIQPGAPEATAHNVHVFTRAPHETPRPPLRRHEGQPRAERSKQRSVAACSDTPSPLWVTCPAQNPRTASPIPTRARSSWKRSMRVSRARKSCKSMRPLSGRPQLFH